MGGVTGMEDWSESDQGRRWIKDVRASLTPKLRDSAITAMLSPGDDPDVKVAVELGMTLLMGKPLIILRMPGRAVPDAVLRAASAVLDVTEADLGSPALAERLAVLAEELAP